MTEVPGLGVIADRWATVPARWALVIRKRPVGPKDETVTAFRDGQVALRRLRRTDGFTEAVQEIGYHGCRAGDLAVHSMDGFAGAIGVAENDGKVSPVVHLYRSADGQSDLRYIAYALRRIAASGYVLSLAKGIRERSSSFDAATLADVLLPVPPLAEQRRIADFLDDQVALLDRAIDLRRRQMTLADRRWLADLSDVYEAAVREGGAVRLGFVIRSLEQGWSPQCENRHAETGEFGVLKAGCVNGGIFRPDQHKALPHDLAARIEYLVRPGDLLMSRASGSVDLIGSAAVVPVSTPGNLILCDKVYRLRLLPQNDAEFVALMVSSPPLREAIKLGTSGAQGMANNLPGGTVRGLRIPVVPVERQRALRDILVERQERKEMSRALLSQSVALLQERKDSLITAAVTGQFNVTAVGRVA